MLVIVVSNIILSKSALISYLLVIINTENSDFITKIIVTIVFKIFRSLKIVVILITTPNFCVQLIEARLCLFLTIFKYQQFKPFLRRFVAT